MSGGQVPPLFPVAAVVAAGALAAGASPAAAEAPRLDGTFKLSGTTVRDPSSGKTQREKIRRTYRFVPRCTTGACNTTLRRESAGGSIRTVQLKKISDTLYRGTEKITGAKQKGGCVLSGTMKFEITVLKTAVLNGVLRATRVRSKSSIRYRSSNCSGYLDERVTLSGNRVQ